MTDVHRAKVVADRLTAIQAEISEKFIEIGQLLLEAFRNHYHRDLGYATFEAFVNDKLEMSVRRSKYLMDIKDLLIDKLEVPREDISQIGWTKAKEILPVVNKENAMQWVNFAKTNTTADINLAVRKSQAPDGQAGELRKYSTFTAFCFDDEKEMIERAIELSKREAGTDRPGRALMLICADYVAEAEARDAESVK